MLKDRWGCRVLRLCKCKSTARKRTTFINSYGIFITSCQNIRTFIKTYAFERFDNPPTLFFRLNFTQNIKYLQKNNPSTQKTHSIHDFHRPHADICRKRCKFATHY